MFRALTDVVAEVLSGRTHHGMMPERPNPAAIDLHDEVARAIRLEGRGEAAEKAMRAIIDESAAAVIEGGAEQLTSAPPSDKSDLHSTAETLGAAVKHLAEQPDVAKVRFMRLEYIGPKQIFLVASVDLVGDDAESDVAHRLRRLEREMENNPYVADAVLTVSEPGE